MLYISKEQIDSVKMENRRRRATKQQAPFSFRFRHRRQSRDTQAGCHLLSPGVSLSPGPDFRPVDRLRPTGGEDKHLPAIPRGQGATIEAERQGQQAAWSPGTSEGHRRDSHTHLPLPPESSSAAHHPDLHSADIFPHL